jgi:CHASE2 domain-containing sensor protein/signal transduction histidine kinase
VFSTALLSALVFTGATTRLDNTLYDLSLKFIRRQPSTQIVIVAVDEPSLAEVGEWPWPRHVSAELISRIGKDRPRAAAWYFVLATATNRIDDEAIHAAMTRTPTYLSLPLRLFYGAVNRHGVVRAASAAAGEGVSDAEGDPDGIVRRAWLFQGEGRRSPTPRLALQLARLVDKGPAAPGDVEPADNTGTIFKANPIMIPYAGGPGTFPRVAAGDVLQGKTPPGFFRNKFVLIGATATSLLDDYPTPVSSGHGMPDVEVDANVLDALLSGATITPASRTSVLALSLSLIWLLLFALVRLGPRDNLWLAAAMAGLPLGGAALALVICRVWIPPAAFIITEAVIVPYWGWRRLNAASAYFAEELLALERSVGEAVIAGSRSAPAVGGDVVLQQMTLLQEAKTRISDLRRFVADVLANFPDPILVVDRAGRILTLNQAAGDFGDRVGLDTAPGSPVEPILARIATIGRDTRPIWPPSEREPAGATSHPITGLGPGGHAYEIRFSATRSAGDDPTGWIIHLTDVTPLVSAMRQREEALQLLSHDMRSPQSAILATLSHPEFQAAPAGLRQRIESHARRTLELADAFVRLAKAETARYALEPIDLAHVVQDAAEAVWPLAHAADVKIEVRTQQVEYVVLADRSLLTRAIVNLLDNAVKFSPAGERVAVSMAPAELDGAAAVALEIADRAGGMGQAEVASLFRRFSPSREGHRGPAGVGLGLTLVHTVVARHNGIIVCDSDDGRGTVFTITLPLCLEADVEAPELAEVP